ncbi:MAG: hypothetical protein EFKGCFLK_02508 [Rhodocyclaceae bacterium]|nr:hypothetical protein [Rhodocyclaceae bacterium]
MGDAGDLVGVEGAAGRDVEHHRGRRLLVVAHEAGLLRDGQVHAGALHGGERLDRARQLAFQGALEVDLLDELRHAELLAFHQFEADQAALGQALGGQAHAQLVHLLLRHQDGAARLGEFERNVHLLQRGDDVPAVALGDVGKQHGIGRRARPRPARNGNRRHHRQGDDAQHLLLQGQPHEGGQRELRIGHINNHRSSSGWPRAGPGHMAAFCPPLARSVLGKSGNFCPLFAGLAGRLPA